MRSLFKIAVVCSALLCAVVTQTAFAQSKIPSPLSLAPCTAGNSKVPADCGTFRVYENRAAQRGRIITLHFIILRAKHKSNRAIYWNPGGPGQAAVRFADDLADGLFQKELYALRDEYNILLLDNRGMGESHPLKCALSPSETPDYYFRQLWPDALLTACRAKLSADSDLSMYTTLNAVDDLDDLRAALGYPKIVLDGYSYGTYFSLIFVRRHPEHVESALLDGVAPPGILILPLEDAAGAQLAMDGLFRECAADAVCREHFPLFAQHFNELTRRLDKGPLPIQVRNPATQRIQTVSLAKEVFADRLRQTLYGPGPAAYVPYIIEQAHDRNFVPLGTMIETTTQSINRLDMGANLSYACAEQIPFITNSAVAETSAHSFMGDTRVRAEQHACAIWHVTPVPADVNRPVRSDLPVLMVSGSNDPTSPPQYAAEELPYLPNAKRALVRGATHATETPCTDALKIALVRAHSAQGLNVSACSTAFKVPPFATSMSGFSSVF